MVKAVVAFDLDDTLYKEIDFVHSAFAYIAGRLENFGCDKRAVYEVMDEAFNKGANPIDAVIGNFDQPFSENMLVEFYRTHKPDIKLNESTCNTLRELNKSGYGLALITDGRTVTQYNKVEALGVMEYIPYDAIFISEATGKDKTTPDNYMGVQKLYSEADAYFYVGDNPAKDFLQPNLLGWTTICVKDNGCNIHSQNIDTEKEALPQYLINDVSDIPQLIKKIIKDKI